MKAVQMISMGAFFLLLGSVAPAYARQEEHEAKPPQQEEKGPPPKQEEKAKPEKQEEKAQPPKQEEKAKPPKQEERGQPAKQEEKAQPVKQEEHAQPARQEEKTQPARQEEHVQPAKQEERAKPETQEHAQQAKAEQHPQQVQRTKQAEERQRAEPTLRLSVHTNNRIPDARFRSNFGSEHRFSIGSPRIVSGYSRFQYGGFWFGFVQPWPGDWYYTDQVYVDFVDGGYYLYNPYYPGVRIGISVVL